jgi:hypothetical protein
MSGVMSISARDAAIRSLRYRANLCIKHPRSSYYLIQLDRAWREFPECERDAVTPPPYEILKLCNSYDRQKEEAEAIAKRLSESKK